MAKIDLEWLTPELIDSMKRESESHSSRINYLKMVKLGWSWYNAFDQWLEPDGELALVDSNLGEDYPISFENMVKKTINDQCSILLMNDPIVHHQPFAERPQDAEIADHMDLMLQALWKPHGANISSVVGSALKEANATGMSVLKVVWDPFNKINGDGEVHVSKVVPKDLFLDPYATNDHRGRDCRYMIHRLWQTPEYIIDRYGDEGEIALGLRNNDGALQYEGKKKGRLWSMFANMTTEQLRSGLPSGEELGDKNTDVDPRVPVYECWLNLALNYDAESMASKKYQGIDLSHGVVATMINGHKVKVISNPYAEYRQVSEFDNELGVTTTERRLLGAKIPPFVLLYHNRSSDKEGQNLIYHCSSITQDIIPAQMSYNALSTNIEINARTIANSALNVIEDALVDETSSRMTNVPGTIRRINANYAQYGVNNVVSASNPGQLPAFVYQLTTDKRGAINELSGVHPDMVGLSQRGTSHMPGSTLAGLQEASFTPLRKPIAELDDAIYDISVLCDGLMQQKYKQGRMVNISNYGVERYIQWQQAHITANFVRQVVAGSTTPIADVDRVNRLTQIDILVTDALMTGNPTVIRSKIILLTNLRDPYVYDYIELLQQQLAELEAEQQGIQELGLTHIANQMQNPQQGQQEMGQLPNDIANALGLAPEDLEAALDNI